MRAKTFYLHLAAITLKQCDMHQLRWLMARHSVTLVGQISLALSFGCETSSRFASGGA